MGRFTNAEKRAEANRELGLRHWVYVKRVEAGSMTTAQKDRYIALMMEIRDDYAALEEKERLL